MQNIIPNLKVKLCFSSFELSFWAKENLPPLDIYALIDSGGLADLTDS